MIAALVTNDDGIDAPGLHRLAWAAREHGLAPVVAAPSRDASGTGAALTAVTEHGRVLVERVELPGLDGVPAFRVAASPGYLTVLAELGAFGPPPDVVLSGINRGANAGRAILHSGTVGAALTAGHSGIRAMAVSLDVLTAAMAGGASGGAAVEAVDAAGDAGRHWDTAAVLVRRLLPGLLAAPAGTVLNLNVPDRPTAGVELRAAGLARFGQTQMAIAETGEGYVRTAVRENGEHPAPGSDLALLADGYATVTPIRPVTHATDITVTW
jgi:5'-nucleotidase